MPPRRRARSAPGSSSSSTAAEAAPRVRLDGGEPLPAKLVGLWKSGRLTDTAVQVEGASFPAHRLVLAAGSEYFETLIKLRGCNLNKKNDSNC